MHLKCCYSSCKSDSRKSEPGIKFMPFPKPNNYGNNWEQQNWQLADCISAAVLCFQGRAILSRHITWRTSEPKQNKCAIPCDPYSYRTKCITSNFALEWKYIEGEASVWALRACEALVGCYAASRQQWLKQGNSCTSPIVKKFPN